MRTILLIRTLLVLASLNVDQVEAFRDMMRQVRSKTSLNDVPDVNEKKSIPVKELKDYSNEASSLFLNLRIPAALFAGAAAGVTYAMPMGEGAEGLLTGFAKRLYALLMINALSTQIVTIVVATAAVASLAGHFDETKANNLIEWMNLHYDDEWTTCKFNFVCGIVSFSVASGIRAWLTLGCPVIATSSLGIILSGTVLSLAFVQKVQQRSGNRLLSLPVKQARVLYKLSRTSPLFFLSFASFTFTALYTLVKIPHLYRFLAAQ